ncbi:GDP-D-mannose pyrophosphorylase [Babesia ovata]|uniref:mannose-1-phosphate guanylyltransferase n=1 Tax=Babesia ovata TaxID=189622 RepID=A0A2H6KCS0_9APIC|nr:GDP-D-mannose pyrophosphorylase [Babesia ovata]GBE60788.1 GDP-D-mannose pyrophosphorylase [Babesia ovata]
MKCLILAGGHGTRLRPLTLTVPKPFMPFCNRPIVEYQIEASLEAGVDHIILAIPQDQSSMLPTIAQLSEKYNVRIDCSIEAETLGTAGPLKFAEKLLCDPEDDCADFLVLNSDVISNYPFSELVAAHRRNSADATILVTETAHPKDFGVIVHDADFRIKAFVEKPAEFISNEINAGVYVVNKSMISHIPPGNVSIERYFFPKLVAMGKTFCHPLTGIWADIGKPKDYIHAQGLYISGHKHNEQINPTLCSANGGNVPEEGPLVVIKTKGGLLIRRKGECNNSAEGTEGETTDDISAYPNIGKDVVIHPPVLVHPSSRIDRGCVLGPNVCIGQNTSIGEGCRILQSTVLEGARLGAHIYVEGSIVGWDCRIHPWVRVEGLSVFGKNVEELANFRKDPPPNCTLEVFGSRNDIWIITWTGLPGTLYAGEKYRLKILFPKEYPLKPPVVYFLQPSPVHAHVYSNGDICMSSLGSDYVPTASVTSFVLSIISMLSNAKEKRLPVDNHLQYLGLGYDVVEKARKSAQDGDTNDGAEFKAPIVQLVWPGANSRRYNNTLRWGLPRNVYAWRVPYYSIKENTTNSEDTKSSSEQLMANLDAKLAAKAPKVSSTDGEGEAKDANGQPTSEGKTIEGNELPAGESKDAISEGDSPQKDEDASEDDDEDPFASLIEESADGDSPSEDDDEEDVLSLDDDTGSEPESNEENSGSDEASLSAKLSVGNSTSSKTSKNQLSKRESCVAFVAGVLLNRRTRRQYHFAGGEVTLIKEKSGSENQSDKHKSGELRGRAKAINAHVDANYGDEQNSSAASNQSSSAMDMLGGKAQADLDRGEFDSKWARTTRYSPMPIKMELTPLAFVFKPSGNEHHYYRALALYVRSGTGKSSKT